MYFVQLKVRDFQAIESADIEFGQAEARTKYGIIGVKCWVFKGEVLARRQRRPQIAGAS